MRNDWRAKYEVDENVIRALSEFNPHWRHKCDAEKRWLLASREDAALEFEHIGITSASGIGSRQIIDIGVMPDRTEGRVTRRRVT